MRVVASPLEASFDREIQFSRLETRFVVITLLRNGKRVSNEGYSREYDKVHLIDSNSNIKDQSNVYKQRDVFKRNVISIPWSNSIRAADIELGPTGAPMYSCGTLNPRQRGRWELFLSSRRRVHRSVHILIRKRGTF